MSFDAPGQQTVEENNRITVTCPQLAEDVKFPKLAQWFFASLQLHCPFSDYEHVRLQLPLDHDVVR